MAVNASGKKSKEPGAGFKKPVQPDGTLAAVVGDEPIPRTEITKKIWDYIRSNKLQDTKNKTIIKADDKLKALFDGKDQVGMFEMTKLVNKHIKK